MTDLRAACIHGRYEKHQFVWNVESNSKGIGSGGGTGAPRWCPGGRQVTIDREAAVEALGPFMVHPFEVETAAIRTVDAAIGDTG